MSKLPIPLPIAEAPQRNTLQLQDPHPGNLPIRHRILARECPLNFLLSKSCLHPQKIKLRAGPLPLQPHPLRRLRLRCSLTSTKIHPNIITPVGNVLSDSRSLSQTYSARLNDGIPRWRPGLRQTDQAPLHILHAPVQNSRRIIPSHRRFRRARSQ